jgi:Secretion system C-terminal sorting domain/FG-GAP-like repeat
MKTFNSKIAILISFLCLLFISNKANCQGFSATATNFNIPSNIDDYDWKTFDTYSRHQILDMNGDGKPDLVDSENEATTSVSDVFLSGNQKYWKVYLNSGSGFGTTATQWNIPSIIDDYDWKAYDTYSRHQMLDVDGDGKPDLVDSENEVTTTVSDVFLTGSQKYWKVYLNTGTGFSATATQWNIPLNIDDYDWKISDTYSRHQVLDVNGDGKPDLVDSENEATTAVSDVFLSGSQKYWKVYLNTGTGFSPTFTQWNIPSNFGDYDWKVYDTYSRHQVIDINGDGNSDLVDSENEITTTVSDVFLSGSQKYWKVYLNTGSGFSSAATQWNIPSNIDDYDWKIYDTYSRHQMLDMNGDGKPDFVDSENEVTTSVSDIFQNGSQKYWKIYLNTGSGFNLSATQWNFPANIDDYDWKVYDTYSRHEVQDINGDGTPDLIDSENEATTSVSDVFLSGSQKYWKVYLNTTVTTSLLALSNDINELKVYPNPFINLVTIEILNSHWTKGDVVIYDLSGKIVYQQSLTERKQSLELNLSRGIYFYKLNNEKEELIGNGKLIVQ